MSFFGVWGCYHRTRTGSASPIRGAAESGSHTPPQSTSSLLVSGKAWVSSPRCKATPSRISVNTRVLNAKDTFRGVLFWLRLALLPPIRPGFRARSARKPVRIPRPQIDKLACQAKGVRIFADGEHPGSVDQHIYGFSRRDLPCLFVVCPQIARRRFG